MPHATAMQLLKSVIIRAETTVGASAGVIFSLIIVMIDAKKRLIIWITWKCKEKEKQKIKEGQTFLML